MNTAVDTNVFLAILYGDDYAETGESELRNAYRSGRVVVTPIVYAELAADGRFDDETELDRFLEDFSIRVEEPSRAALFAAGERFNTYTARCPDVQCPSCGTEQFVRCTECDESLAPRQHIAADFLIGSHATVDADALVSFDSGFYGTYFPSLTCYPE